MRTAFASLTFGWFVVHIVAPALAAPPNPPQTESAVRSECTSATSDERSEAVGDLDGDGTPDLVVVCAATPEPPTFGQRTLVVYLRDHDGTLRRVAASAHAVLRGDEGGMMGDPFMGVSVTEKGTLVIEHYGGSADRWMITQKFAFRRGDLYQIGETRGHLNALDGTGTSVDTNLLTGRQIQTTIRPPPQEDDVAERRVPTQPLVRLVDSSAVP